jgi:hypothetical protein
MFSTICRPDWQIVRSGAYRGTRESELLKQGSAQTPGHTRFIQRFTITSRSSPFLWDSEIAVVRRKPRLRIARPANR